MPTFALARVTEAISSDARAQRLMVQLDSGDEPAVAVAYPRLVGECREDDKVLLNTTAVELDLGTGGEHFVVVNLTRPLAAALSGGHIMKLRYTPHQLDVLAAEEPGSDLAEGLAEALDLGGRRIVVLALHSQLAGACAVARREAPEAKVVFVMSDATSLPLGVSRLVERLEKDGLLDLTVTCGQAFGGDIETVNRLTGLLAAVAAGADLVIAGTGPGSVGTGTALGHSGVDVGEWVNAVAALGGVPVVAPRISVADPRARHQGLSHHTRTALSVMALAEAQVALPTMDATTAGAVRAAIESDEGLGRHRWQEVPDVSTLDAMDTVGLADVTTMGRPCDEEPALFEAAGAAVRLALEQL